MDLWSEHLGVLTDELYDAIAPELYWRKPRRTAGIKEYTVAGVGQKVVGCGRA